MREDLKDSSDRWNTLRSGPTKMCQKCKKSGAISAAIYSLCICIFSYQWNMVCIKEQTCMYNCILLYCQMLAIRLSIDEILIVTIVKWSNRIWLILCRDGCLNGIYKLDYSKYWPTLWNTPPNDPFQQLIYFDHS